METLSMKSDYTLEDRQSVTTDAFTTSNEQDSSTISTADSLVESSSVLAFYFKIALILIGIVGVFANGATLFALIFAKQVMRVSVSVVNKLSIVFS
jgi:hypothetical protein